MKLPKGMTIYGQHGRPVKGECSEAVFKSLDKKTQDKIKSRLKVKEGDSLKPEKENAKSKSQRL